MKKIITIISTGMFLFAENYVYKPIEKTGNSFTVFEKEENYIKEKEIMILNDVLEEEKNIKTKETIPYNMKEEIIKSFEEENNIKTKETIPYNMKEEYMR